MLRVRTVPSFGFILMGSIDWLTTIIGIFYFGVVEANPFIANIASTSLPAFTTVKLATTIVVGLLFYRQRSFCKKLGIKLVKPSSGQTLYLEPHT
jgi:Domain of unknown function (DUF5658)